MVTTENILDIASAGNPVNWFIVVNSWSNGFLSLGLLISMMLILVTIMRSNGQQMHVAVPVALFVGSIISGIGMIITYNGHRLFEVVHFSVILFMLVISIIVLSLKSGLQGE